MMQTWKKACFSGLFLCLSGCADISSALNTVEVTPHMLDDHTVAISGSGSGTDSMSSVQQAVFRSAATTAKSSGYQYFLVLNEQKTQVPGPSSSYGSKKSRHTYQLMQPREELTARFYRTGEVDPNQPGVFNADTVLAESTK
ncbi:hypothetical protein [Acetobacter senegalensis]|uniref:hypothetical protein n=1 Tax=Acetobacter senegalensis TaxID=446692 RepID=UPI00073E4D21|nr:hypothetical protein [Acetobacter senegalensis]MCG4256797.1 hypothetical protein [Acetobacter senegalensis]MCG4266642.1 hypothetical protein [Acetobacter senegalensis]MCG4274800.1 hypothetical protein [Acetobacter senegalensis]MPQ73099.1 hypothetical protein [Acetobacter senegalensis]